MEGRGELAPIKEQCIKGLWRMLQLGQECVIDGLMAGRIHPGQAWIPTVATWDKLQATHAGGEERAAKGDPLPAVVAERIEALRRLAGRASDSGSAVPPAQPIDSLASTPSVTSDLSSMDTDRSQDQAAGVDGRGGGSAPRGGAVGDGLVPEILDSKEVSGASVVSSTLPK